MKTVFIYWAPHPLHKKWAESVTKFSYPFICKSMLNLFRKTNPIIHQILSLLCSWKIPKADVYLIENLTCILPAIIRKKQNSKIILLNADNFFADLSKMNGIKKNILKWYLKHVDGMISNSDFSANLAKKHISVPCEIVYPGIDNNFFNVNANTTSNNIAHGMSALRKQKGTDLVIEAFHKMKNPGKLYLIGPQLEYDVVIPKEKNIIFTGWTTNAGKYLKECGIYMNPARFESFGMNIVEAMAAGFAPIVSENCGAKELVKKVSNRLIIKPNVKEIISAIDWLNKDNRKKTLGKKAKTIAKDYKIDKSILNFKKTFNNMVCAIKK